MRLLSCVCFSGIIFLSSFDAYGINKEKWEKVVKKYIDKVEDTHPRPLHLRRKLQLRSILTQAIADGVNNTELLEIVFNDDVMGGVYRNQKELFDLVKFLLEQGFSRLEIIKHLKIPFKLGPEGSINGMQISGISIPNIIYELMEKEKTVVKAIVGLLTETHKRNPYTTPMHILGKDILCMEGEALSKYLKFLRYLFAESNGLNINLSQFGTLFKVEHGLIMPFCHFLICSANQFVHPETKPIAYHNLIKILEILIRSKDSFLIFTQIFKRQIRNLDWISPQYECLDFIKMAKRFGFSELITIAESQKIVSTIKIALQDLGMLQFSPVILEYILPPGTRSHSS